MIRVQIRTLATVHLLFTMVLAGCGGAPAAPAPAAPEPAAAASAPAAEIPNV